MAMKPVAIRPGSGWYFLPAFLFIFTAIIVPVGIVGMLARDNLTAFQLAVPGQKEFEIPKAGRYVVWDETETVYHGQTFSTSNQLPSGIRIRLLGLKANNEVMMTTGMSSTMTVGRTVRRSVGTFDVRERGRYRLSVEGQFPQRIFYFRESVFHQVSIVLAGAGLLALGLLASLVSAGIIFFKRRSSA